VKTPLGLYVGMADAIAHPGTLAAYFTLPGHDSPPLERGFLYANGEKGKPFAAKTQMRAP
jgi:hypothetical protein